MSDMIYCVKMTQSAGDSHVRTGFPLGFFAFVESDSVTGAEELGRQSLSMLSPAVGDFHTFEVVPLTGADMEGRHHLKRRIRESCQASNLIEVHHVPQRARGMKYE